jgi:hypothetical protein
VLRQGPVPAFVHGAAEYLAGPLFIAAPFLFDFESNAARAFAVVVGLAILVHTASSALPTGLAKVIPVSVHAAFDFGLSIVLVAAPFLLGFSDESAPTAFFIVLGVLVLLLTIATRFVGEAGRVSPP